MVDSGDSSQKNNVPKNAEFILKIKIYLNQN
jgi:hypothetical protein